MEIFSLMAKLTLDTEEYEKALNQAESQGGSLQDPDSPSLDLDTSSFDSKILSAENADVDDPDDPELDLDKSAFDKTVTAAEGTDVDDPDDPELDLDKSAFDKTVTAAEGTDVDDPDDPKLDLDKSAFDKVVTEAEAVEVDDPSAPELDLDDTKFDSTVLEAEDVTIEDPATPELDLDATPFFDTVDEAENTEVADPPTPSLDLDSDGFSQGLSDALESTSLFSVNVGSIFDDIKQHLAAAGIAVGIKSIVDSLSEAVDLARSMGDSIDKSSRAMSISTDAYQEWSHVLDINGASITDLNRGLMNMRKMMGGGEASSEFTEAMDSLGLSAKVANGEIKTTEDLLEASLKALTDFGGTSAERDYLAQAIFGRGGTKLNAMFDGTSQDIDYLIQQAHELGLVMSESEIANAAAYNDSVTNMQASLTAFKTSLATEILPILTEIMNSGAKIIAFFNWRTGDTPLSKQFEDIDNGSMDALASINMTESVAGNLADKLIAMGDASKLTAEQQAVWKGTAEELIGLIPSLSGIIDTDTMSIKGNKDAINENINAWANLARERALAQAKEEKQRALIERNKDAIEAQVAMNVKAAEAEAARSQAIDEVNKVLEKYGRSERLSEDATAQDITQLRSDIGFDRRNLELQKELSQAEDIYGKPLRELSELQAQFESYQAQLAAGQAEYEAWAAAAEQIFGTASESATAAEADVNAVNTAINNLPKNKQVLINILTRWDLPVALPKAKGDWDVPWDNYPALLHRGERVLTASQARQDRSENNSIDMAGLSEAIESSIRAGMAGATVQSFLNGKDITRAVSKELGNQMKARRFSS